MIIYTDLVSGDEIMSDVFDIKDAGDGLWEIDGKVITKGADNFQLEGANPSAEGEDADEGGEGDVERVIDFVDQFRLNQIEAKPSKKVFTAEMKKYMKEVLTKMQEKSKPAEDIAAFKTGAQNAIKKILANYDNYDLFVGESMTENSMYVLVDYRDDGVTPYATIWKYGLDQMKV